MPTHIPPESFKRIPLNSARRKAILADAILRFHFPVQDQNRKNAHEYLLGQIRKEVTAAVPSTDREVLSRYSALVGAEFITFYDPEGGQNHWGNWKVQSRFDINYRELRPQEDPLEGWCTSLFVPKCWCTQENRRIQLPRNLQDNVWSAFLAFKEADERARGAYREAEYDLKAALKSCRTLQDAVDAWPVAAAVFSRYDVGVPIEDAETRDRLATIKLRTL